jgi:hypothetical protein
LAVQRCLVTEPEARDNTTLVYWISTGGQCGKRERRPLEGEENPFPLLDVGQPG